MSSKKKQDSSEDDLRDLRDQIPFDEEKWYSDARKKNWRAIDKQISAPVDITYTFGNED